MFFVKYFFWKISTLSITVDTFTYTHLLHRPYSTWWWIEILTSQWQKCSLVHLSKADSQIIQRHTCHAIVCLQDGCIGGCIGCIIYIYTLQKTNNCTIDNYFHFLSPANNSDCCENGAEGWSFHRARVHKLLALHNFWKIFILPVKLSDVDIDTEMKTNNRRWHKYFDHLRRGIIHPPWVVISLLTKPLVLPNGTGPGVVPFNFHFPGSPGNSTDSAR